VAEAICDIVELRMTEAGLTGTILCPVDMQPAPGQYLLAHSGSPDDLLPVPLFRADPADGRPEMAVAAPLPPAWQAASRLHVRGPLGSGFHLPPDARSVALAAVDASEDRLMPLVHQALAQGASVTLFTAQVPAGLPFQVEALPPAVLPEAVRWADYLALDLPAGKAADWRSILRIPPGARCPCTAEVLVRAPMPCGGRALCGVCSLRTRSGWKLICRDGPVFDLNELE